VSSVEVIGSPTNIVINEGSTATFTVTASGQSAPGYQWQTNGVNLTNGTKYANVTTAALAVSNVLPPDTLVGYSCVVTNLATNLNGNSTGLYQNIIGQAVTSTVATVTIVPVPSDVVVSPAIQTNLWGSSATFSVTNTGSAPFTYGWMKGAVNLANSTKYSGTSTTTLTISNLTDADAGSYTVGVTNSYGSNSSAGVLVVSVPPPAFSAVSVSGGNVALTFKSTNSFDTTNAFILLSSPVATGPYTNTPATITGGSGTFQTEVPETGSNMFYLLQHVN